MHLASARTQTSLFTICRFKRGRWYLTLPSTALADVYGSFVATFYDSEGMLAGRLLR